MRIYTISTVQNDIFQGRTMVAIKRGSRRALIPEDCSARAEVLAKRHLVGKSIYNTSYTVNNNNASNHGNRHPHNGERVSCCLF